MPRSKVVKGKKITFKAGEIENFWWNGFMYGTVVTRGSIAPTILHLGGACAESYSAVISDHITAGNIYDAMARLNTPKADLLDFQEDIDFMNKYAYWLCGDVEHGGTFLIYYNDPNYPENYYCGACNGVYSQEIYGDIYYKYAIGGGMEPYRTQAELDECFIAYGAGESTLHWVCMKTGGRIQVNEFTIDTAVSPFVYYYKDIGYINSLEDFEVTKAVTLTPLSSPDYAHNQCWMMNEGTEGGMNDLGCIFDDENYPLENFQHVSGNWFGGDAIQPNPDENNQEDDGYEEPEYHPYEDDRLKTTDDQFEIDAINSGLVTIFNPSQQEVIEFGQFLFSGITENIADFFKRLMASPLDYIINLNLVHYDPEVEGAAEIKFGGIGSGVASMVVAKQFQKLEFGTIEIAGQFDTYLDYAGFTKEIKIYIPYCGKHSIDVDISMGAKLTLDMYIDNLSGACIAQLVYEKGHRYPDDRNVDGQVYEFTGNVFQEVPLSASDYRAAIQGVLTATAGVGSFIAGNPVSGAGAIASGVMAMKPTIQHSGKSGSNYGYMGSQFAYVEIYRPNPAQPPDYYKYAGYPASWTHTISDLYNPNRGDPFFIQARKDGIKLNGLQFATDEEIAEIEKLFEEGVYL